jgi:hypothetical protein
MATDKTTYSTKETAKKRDDIVRRMLATPPKPFTPKAKKKKANAKKS